MTTTELPNAGWYPDPGNQQFEVYWNGASWTTMRRPVAGPRPGAVPGLAPGLQGLSSWVSAQSASLVETWKQSGVGTRIAIAGGAAAILITPFYGLAQFASDQKIRNDCSHMADYQGYRGENKDTVVDFCVQFQKDFGTSHYQ